MQSPYEVAGVLNAHWPQVQQSARLNSWQLRTLDAVRRCRSASLGAHVDGCTSCGHLRISYNSCRNRHCPKCQGNEREKWIQARQAELLPVPYFHVVFTLPDTLNTLCLHKDKEVYNILFQSAWYVLNTFGHDPKWLGAQTGMISILHTWGQTMTLHPHLHCIVPGGGIRPSPSGEGPGVRWKTAKSEGKPACRQGRYLFNVNAMSKVFRGKFIALLKETLPAFMPADFINELYKKDWVVYAKRPFSGPESVVEYLGRYTHKIAISNHRIKNVEEGKVTFSYKDYKQAAVKKEMTLDGKEFIRRFAMHILPKGFVRIRHFGILSNTSKTACAIVIKEQLPPMPEVKNAKPKKEMYNPLQCPCCKKETMHTILRFNRRGPPPADWEDMAMKLLECLV